MPTLLCRIHILGRADFPEVLCFGSHNTCLAIYVEPDLSVSEPPNPFPSACPFVFPQKFKHLRFLSGARRCQSTLWGFYESAAALLRDPFSPSNPNNTDRDTLTSESEDGAGSHMHVCVCARLRPCVCATRHATSPLLNTDIQVCGLAGDVYCPVCPAITSKVDGSTERWSHAAFSPPDTFLLLSSSHPSPPFLLSFQPASSCSLSSLLFLGVGGYF